MIARISRIDVGWLLVITGTIMSLVTVSASGQAASRQTPQPLTAEQRQHVMERRAISKTARDAAFKESVERQNAFRASFEKGKAAKLAAENERVRVEIARLSRAQ
jgi:hypothetical protein